MTNWLVSVIWKALTFLASLSYSVFLTTSLFTTALSLIKLTGLVSNLSISYLPILSFKFPKSNFLANFDVSIPLAFFKSDFMAYRQI